MTTMVRLCYVSPLPKIVLARRRGILRAVRCFGQAGSENGRDRPTTTRTGKKKEEVERIRTELNRNTGLDPNGDHNAWEVLWNEGVTPWDLGGPTMALISELDRKHKEEQETLRWTTALLPGCGSGHDLVSMARFWDGVGDKMVPIERTVVGLDVSPTSLERAKALLLEATGPAGHKQLMTTDVQLYLGDFFDDPSTWTLYHHEKSTGIKPKDDTATGLGSDQTFDFIFDYTFFCAIPPSRRSEWGQQMTRLLTRLVDGDDTPGGKITVEIDRTKKSHQKEVGGQLLTLMFPYVPTARPESPGPPYLVTLSDYEGSFHKCNAVTTPRKAGLHLTTMQPYESMDTAPSRRGQELVGWWSFGNSHGPSRRAGD